LTNLEELEQLFFKVISDLEEFLPYLVIVGGWVPYLYVKYLWKNFSVYPVTTTDIDFGFSESDKVLSVKESIYSRLSRLQYSERHLKMDRLFPIVPMLEHPKKTSKLMIEFITTTSVKDAYIERFIGRQILVNRIDKFDILLHDRIQIEPVDRKVSPYHSYIVNVPPPYIFLFHKALTFIDRENQEKKAKDIYYVYYVLRFHPKKESLFKDLKTLSLYEEKESVVANLGALFSRISSQGCLMVEQENGPDNYISDVRKDAFERFNELIDALSY
jgi:hypothetical protein